VSGGALAWQQVLVDGRLHDRMNEAEELIVGEHARPDEEIRDRSRLPRVDIGHLRRDADIGLSAEHRHGAGQRRGGGSEPLQPAQDEPADRPRPDVAHGPGRRAGGRHLRVGQRGDQLAQEEGVPTGRAVAGPTELVRRVVP
jgi:hypothetical protein